MVSGIVKAEVVVSLTSPPDDVVPGDVNSGFGVWNNQPAFKHTDKDYTTETKQNQIWLLKNSEIQNEIFICRCYVT